MFSSARYRGRHRVAPRVLYLAAPLSAFFPLGRVQPALGFPPINRLSLVIAFSRQFLSTLLALCGVAAAGGLGCDHSRPLPTPPPPSPAFGAAHPGAPEAGPGVGEQAQWRPRGLWVLAEGSQRVLEDPARLSPLLETATRLGVSDLFVQVYRGGRSWYASDLADASPYRALIEATGVDTLKALIAGAHARGIRVHAWVNVFSLSLNPEAPILQKLGRDAVLVDRSGRNLLDYPNFEIPAPDGDWYRMGTRGIYLDPGAPGVEEILTATFVELVLRYPALDGLHLDYVRHPGALPFVPGSRFGVGLDFGYGMPSRVRFGQETGLSGPYRNRENPSPSALVNANAWDHWRREKVTQVVASIATEARAARPGLAISAAVISYADRAYLSLSQDWPLWLEEGWIDLAIPMVYTLDDRLLRYQLERFGRAVERQRIWSGLGVWLFARSPERAVRQIEIARAAGLEGDVLFSYDAIADAPELEAALADAFAGAGLDDDGFAEGAEGAEVAEDAEGASPSPPAMEEP